MNINLIRIRYKTETIDGVLKIDGIRVCDTAENVNGAVPAGTYTVFINKCKQHGRKMICLNPECPCRKCKKLKAVSNNTSMPCYCPQICPGNGVYNRHDGAILLGQYLAPGCLIRPLAAFSKVYDRIRMSLSRGHKVKLVVK